MEYRDYYAALGVSKDAGQADIRKAFRRLAREHHPDVNKGAEAERRFKEISEAHEVLADPEKRRAYDQLGANWAAYQRAGGGGAGPFAGFGATGSGASPGGVRFEFHGNSEDLAGFSDFFRTFFAGGSGGGRTASSGGIDIDPLFGGIGGDSGAGYAASGFGSGSPRGTRRQHVRRPADATAEATLSLEEVLLGTERHLEVGGKRLEVTIPPGVRDSQRIRLSGKAEGGGDVYITVHVRPHAVFKRDGADILRELPLTLEEALLGGEVKVRALSGRDLLLTIPPSTHDGRLFRLKGQGLPMVRQAGSGDLLVRTHIVLPAALDEQSQRLARELFDHLKQPDPRQLAATP